MTDKPSDVEMVYGYLLTKFMNAARKNDEAKHARVLAAIELFEELWPDDTARWKARFGKAEKSE